MRSRQSRTITVFPNAQVEDGRLYSIAQVAEALGLTLRAVRFYCQKGLVAERRSEGRHYFDAHAMRRLSLVTQGKVLNLSLREIASMLVDRSETGHGPVLVVPERLVRRQVDALRERNESMLAIIDRSVLQGSERPSQPSKALRPKLVLVG